MEANRITRYAWWAVGALTCLIALAAMWRLWDAGKAQAQTEPMKEEVTKAEKACPPAPLPEIKVTEPPLAETPPPPLPEITPVKAEVPAAPPGPPGADVPPPPGGVVPPPTGDVPTPPAPEVKPPSEKPVVKPTPLAPPPPPAGSDEKPIIIPGKPAPTPAAPPKMVPVPEGEPLPPLNEKALPPPPMKDDPPVTEKPRAAPKTIPVRIKKPDLEKVEARTFTVRTAGTTVKTLAREVLGSVERWPEICKLNPSLTESSTLTVGTTVVLPGDANMSDSEVTPLPTLRARTTPKPRPVLPLTGTFPLKLDDKGHLVLPEAVLRQLGRSSTVLVSPGSDRCLWLTNQSHLDRLSAKLDRSPAPEKDVRTFKRLYYAQTVKVPLAGDKVHVSERLAAFAGLSQDVVLVGIDDHFEVWDAAKWRKYTVARKATVEKE